MSIREAVSLASDDGEPYVWWFLVERHELADVFGSRRGRGIGPNVLMLSRPPAFAPKKSLSPDVFYDASEVISKATLERQPTHLPITDERMLDICGDLTFDPDYAQLILATDSDEALVVMNIVLDSQEQQVEPSLRPGDQQYVDTLPARLREIGQKLIHSVRLEYRGDLRLYKQTGKYIETPDNWWTVKPQPRAGSLAITVRGLPDSFPGDAEFAISKKGANVIVSSVSGQGGRLELKKDRGSSSRFVVKTEDELTTAFRIIAWASKNRR